MHYSRGTGETPGERQSLKTGDKSVLVTPVGICRAPLRRGRGREWSWGAPGDGLATAELGQQCLLPVHVLGVKGQQECLGRASRAHPQDWPWQEGVLAPQHRFLFSPVMKSVDSEVWLIFNVRWHIDTDLKEEVNVRSYLLCFSQISMMTDFNIPFRITLGKDVPSPGCSPWCGECSGNAK